MGQSSILLHPSMSERIALLRSFVCIALLSNKNLTVTHDLVAYDELKLQAVRGGHNMQWAWQRSSTERLELVNYKEYMHCPLRERQHALSECFHSLSQQALFSFAVEPTNATLMANARSSRLNYYELNPSIHSDHRAILHLYSPIYLYHMSNRSLASEDLKIITAHAHGVRKLHTTLAIYLYPLDKDTWVSMTALIVVNRDSREPWRAL